MLWAAWHLPLFLIRGRPQTAMPFVGFMLAVTAASVLMAWVQCNARSGLSAVLFHAAMNTGFAAFGVLTNGRPLFWLTTGVWVLVAVVVYLTTGLRAA